MNTIVDYNKKRTFVYPVFAGVAKIFFVFALLLFNTGLLLAEKYVMGGKVGWDDIAVRNGIATGSGRYGYESLLLDTNSRKINPFTDLLIDFENGVIQDKVGKYKIVENGVFITEDGIMGKGAGISRGRKGIVLKGDDESFFGSQGPAGSFLFDFWLCPALIENGEIILNWRSSRIINGAVAYQVITFSFYQNRFVCTLLNVFDGYTENAGEVTLYGSKKLIPNKWAHHTISYEEENGELSYKLDGEMEDVIFITSTGHEGGTVYNSYIGKSVEVEICPNYTGMIDDFSISRSFISIEQYIEKEKIGALNPSIYATSGGRIVSKPILTKPGSILKRVCVDAVVPDQTEIDFYVRSGENQYDWTEDFPKWKPIKNGEKINGVSGVYFQVAANLFPDGAGMVSPAISSIELDYAVLPNPQPPHKLSVEKGDSSVMLSWSYSVDDSTGGYYIFYGNKPGEYLGRISAEGCSPLDAGNATSYKITGLENGTIYYFAVAAYSKYDENIRGELSKEVYARPGK